jgi:hypothetical protein
MPDEQTTETPDTVRILDLGTATLIEDIGAGHASTTE